MTIAWDIDQPYRVVNTLDDSIIDGNETAAEVLLRITTAQEVPVAAIASKRYIVTDHLGNELPYREILCNLGGTYADIAVVTKANIYASPSGDQNRFAIYFGSVGSDQADPVNAHDANTAAAIHCDGAAYTDLDDDTSNGVDIDTYSGSNYAFDQAGHIGKCININAANAYLEHQGGTLATSHATLTMFAVFKETSGSFQVLAGSNKAYWLSSSHVLNFWNVGVEYLPLPSITFSAGTWYATALTFSDAANTTTGASFDGTTFQTDSQSATGAVASGNGKLSLGCDLGFHSVGWNGGSLEYFRWDTAVRSAAYNKWNTRNWLASDNEQSGGAVEERPSVATVDQIMAAIGAAQPIPTRGRLVAVPYR